MHSNILAIVWVAAVVAACSTDDSGGNAGGSETGGAGDSGGAGGSAGSGATGGAGGGSSGEGGQAGGGVTNEAPVFLQVAQWEGADGNPAAEVAVVTYSQSDPAKRCYTHETGSCAVMDCRTSKYGALSPYSSSSAGTITVSGGTGPDIVLRPKTNGSYDASTEAGTKWSPGDAIRMSAPGDELRAFDVEATMPTPMDFLQPDVENAGPDDIHIDGARGFMVTWTPTDNEVFLQLLEDSGGTEPDFLLTQCRFPGSSGAGEIPLALMGGYEGGKALTLFCPGHVQVVEKPLGARILRSYTEYGTCRHVVIE